nr:BURP domain-containing protein 5-like [Ziziphus jujuba var. spinosa]
MEDSLKLCEAPAIKGEAKYCATSLESLVDFGVSKLGNKMEIFHDQDTGRRATKIYHRKRNTEGWRQDTKAYRVPLKMQHQQEDDVAIAVCHSDTSSWNPKHAAFQQLKVKPGIVPICHFLCSDTLFLVNKLLEIK